MSRRAGLSISRTVSVTNSSLHALARARPPHVRTYAAWDPSHGQPKKEDRRDPKFLIRNENIKEQHVQLKHPVTGELLPLAPLSVILAAMDSETTYLEAAGMTDSNTRVVRLISKKEEYNKARKAAAKKIKPPKTVELQMSWSVGEGDLGTKLAKTKKELEDGNRVDLVFMLKKNSPLPNPERRAELLNKAMEHLVGYGKEWKERTNDRVNSILHLERDPTLAAKS
jgi:hypothetical protein